MLTIMSSCSFMQHVLCCTRSALRSTVQRYCYFSNSPGSSQFLTSQVLSRRSIATEVCSNTPDGPNADGIVTHKEVPAQQRKPTKVLKPESEAPSSSETGVVDAAAPTPGSTQVGVPLKRSRRRKGILKSESQSSSETDVVDAGNSRGEAPLERPRRRKGILKSDSEAQSSSETGVVEAGSTQTEVSLEQPRRLRGILKPESEAPSSSEIGFVDAGSTVKEVPTRRPRRPRRKGILKSGSQSSREVGVVDAGSTRVGTPQEVPLEQPRRRSGLFKNRGPLPVILPEALEQQQMEQQYPVVWDEPQHHFFLPKQAQEQQKKNFISQEQEQQQQQQQDKPRARPWWDHRKAKSQLSVHVFWDLDNLRPDHWSQTAEVVKLLHDELSSYGHVQQLRAYATSKTLVYEVDEVSVQEAVEMEELRCDICGRRCKSFDDLQKHFRQLHEPEHQKKLRAPKKHAAKYAKTDKAKRVREAARTLGHTKKNRSGRRGQMVKMLLQQAGVQCIEVGSQKQAADDCINRHLFELIKQLSEPSSQSELDKTDSLGALDTPWGWGCPLQRAVLVIISDDRGFASSIASWLRAQGVGAVLVTNRSSSAWQQPLHSALGDCSERLFDVAQISWEDIIMQCSQPEDSDADPFADITLYNMSHFMSW